MLMDYNIVKQAKECDSEQFTFLVNKFWDIEAHPESDVYPVIGAERGLLYCMMEKAVPYSDEAFEQSVERLVYDKQHGIYNRGYLRALISTGMILEVKTIFPTMALITISGGYHHESTIACSVTDRAIGWTMPYLMTPTSSLFKGLCWRLENVG